MGSENPSGADNQQETIRLELDPHWVVGFVDGEGCFSVSIHQNPVVRRTRGWQVNPVFHVYQHEEYRAVLEELVVFFGCGRIRSKGPKSSVLTFAVDRLADQVAHIVPFFERYPLVIKAKDFALYASVVRSVRAKEHLAPLGFERVVRLAYAMNANGKQRKRTLDKS
jgi:hypothetical protein